MPGIHIYSLYSCVIQKTSKGVCFVTNNYILCTSYSLLIFIGPCTSLRGAQETLRHFSTISMCAKETCQPCEHATTASWTNCRRRFRVVWVPSIYLNQAAPHCEGQGRPDIVILNEEAKKAYLVNVAIPRGSEETSGPPGSVRWNNTEVLLESFLVGTWDPENNPLLYI